MSTAHSIRAGLFALPVYGLLTAWPSLKPQPDQETGPEEWAQFVGEPSYLVGHVVGSTGGTVLAIFGVFVLGAYLAAGKTDRGAARDGGHRFGSRTTDGACDPLDDYNACCWARVPGRSARGNGPGVSRRHDVHYLLGLLLAFVGSVLLGVAVWQLDTLPAWAGGL